MLWMPFSGPDQIHLDETDDNAVTARSPSAVRAPRRTSKPLPACIPSKWDETGRPTAIAARRSACRNARWRLPLSALRHQPVQSAAKLIRRCRPGLAAGVDHDIPNRRELGQTNPQRFSETSLHTIALGGISELPRNSESQSGSFARGARDLQAKSCKIRAGNSLPLVIRSAEVRSSQNPDALRKPEASRRTVRLFRR